MPIYVYECRICKARVEQFRKPSEIDDPAPFCPNACAIEDDSALLRTSRVLTAPASSFPGADSWRGGR